MQKSNAVSTGYYIDSLILIMFDADFISAIVSLGNGAQEAKKLWVEIAAKYSEKTRFYHTLQHLENIYQNLLEVRGTITDWHKIIFSIAFHDVIYDARRNDNEEQSAIFAETKLKEARYPEAGIKKCKEQILATKTHRLSTDNDTNYFTDADLSILGAPSEEYALYTQNIRKEFSQYPDHIYNTGRKNVLIHFLQMPCIFKSRHFQIKYEERARANLDIELKNL